MPGSARRFPEGCPVCEKKGLDRSIELPGLRVARCRACGHRVAMHDAEPGPDRDYHEQYGRWADKLSKLGLPGAGVERLEVTSHGFEATAVVPGNAAQRWHIASDARVWKD